MGGREGQGKFSSIYQPRQTKRLKIQLAPGDFVRHPTRPDWGLGQVQSVIGDRVTVNFEDAGKVLVNGALVELERVDPGQGGGR